MKENKKSIWRSKKMMFGIGFCILLLSAVIFWRPMREKCRLYKDWRHERRIQVVMGQKPYSWGEYMDYLQSKKDFELEEIQRLRDAEQKYVDDARTSLGGDTPEEAYEMLRQALRDNDLERALSLSFLDYREGAREALQPYADKNELPSLIEEWNLDDIDCSKSTEQLCKKENEYSYCAYHGELICSAPEINFEGYLYPHTVEFKRNILDKWQLKGY